MGRLETGRLQTNSDYANANWDPRRGDPRTPPSCLEKLHSHLQVVLQNNSGQQALCFLALYESVSCKGT